MCGKAPRFAGHYGITLGTAIASLVPFIMFTAAFPLFRVAIIRDLHAAAVNVDIANDIATAGYAFGALLGGDLIQRFPQRRLFLLCEGTFVAGAVIAAAAPNALILAVGYTIQGLMTGFLLVVALPPVIQQFPVEKLPITAAMIDVGFFGGVTLGPVLAGALASVDGWRWLYGAIALLALIVFVLASMTLALKDPPNPGLRFDRTGVALGFIATALPFWGVAELTGSGFTSPLFLAPFIIGGLCFLALLIVEFNEEEPVSPVKPMWNTLPVVGVIIAMVGGGAYFTVFTLAEEYLVGVALQTPTAAGLMFWPQVVGAIVASIAFGLVVKTRWLAPFALAGMLCVIAGGIIITTLTAGASLSTFAPAVALLGLGAGATVAPGLWFASLSLQSKMVGRIFALVELIRSEANFLLAPIMLAVAVAISGGGTVPTAHGLHDAMVYTLILTVVLLIAGVVIYVAGRPGFQRPDLALWLKGEQPAWKSPDLFSGPGPPAA